MSDKTWGLKRKEINTEAQGHRENYIERQQAVSLRLCVLIFLHIEDSLISLPQGALSFRGKRGISSLICLLTITIVINALCIFLVYCCKCHKTGLLIDENDFIFKQDFNT